MTWNSARPGPTQRRVQPRRLAAAAVATGLVAALAAPAAAAPSPSPQPAAAAKNAKAPVVTFGIQPATATAKDTRPFLSYSASPGAVFLDHVALLNFSLQPLALALGATDAVNTDNGGFGLLSSDQKPTDLGAWIGIPEDAREVTVPARKSVKSGPGQVIVPIEVKVPANAAPGDHVAGVLAVLSTVSKKSNGQNVRLDQRVATRVFLRVSGPLKPDLQVENLRVSYHGTANPAGRGHVTLDYTIRNAGNVKLGAHQTISTDGWFGTATDGPKVADVPLLFPGNAIQQHVDVTGVWPALRVTGHVALVPLRLEGDADGALPQVSNDAGTWAIPWTLVAIVVAVLLLVIGGAWWRRRRKKKAAANPPAAPKSAAEPEPAAQAAGGQA